MFRTYYALIRREQQGCIVIFLTGVGVSGLKNFSSQTKKYKLLQSQNTVVRINQI